MWERRSSQTFSKNPCPKKKTFPLVDGTGGKRSRSESQEGKTKNPGEQCRDDVVTGPKAIVGLVMHVASRTVAKRGTTRIASIICLVIVSVVTSVTLSTQASQFQVHILQTCAQTSGSVGLPCQLGLFTLDHKRNDQPRAGISLRVIAYLAMLVNLRTKIDEVILCFLSLFSENKKLFKVRINPRWGGV